METIDVILKDVHPELASVLSMQAYERAHSAGADEVRAVLRGLVHDFRDVNKKLWELQNCCN